MFDLEKPSPSPNLDFHMLIKNIYNQFQKSTKKVEITMINCAQDRQN